MTEKGEYIFCHAERYETEYFRVWLYKPFFLWYLKLTAIISSALIRS